MLFVKHFIDYHLSWAPSEMSEMTVTNKTLYRKKATSFRIVWLKFTSTSIYHWNAIISLAIDKMSKHYHFMMVRCVQNSIHWAKQISDFFFLIQQRTYVNTLMKFEYLYLTTISHIITDKLEIFSKNWILIRSHPSYKLLKLNLDTFRPVDHLRLFGHFFDNIWNTTQTRDKPHWELYWALLIVRKVMPNVIPNVICPLLTSVQQNGTRFFQKKISF